MFELLLPLVSDQPDQQPPEQVIDNDIIVIGYNDLS